MQIIDIIKEKLIGKQIEVYQCLVDLECFVEKDKTYNITDWNKIITTVEDIEFENFSDSECNVYSHFNIIFKEGCLTVDINDEITIINS